MANTKNGVIRERTLDRCLQNRRGYSTTELMEKVNDELGRYGYELVTATNTIRNDLTAIANRFHVRIEGVRSGRNIRYRYSDPGFSIFNTSLTDDEVMELRKAVLVVNRFEGMPGFEWVTDFNASVHSAVTMSAEPVVGFDENNDLRGLSFFSPILEHIDNHHTLEITYKSYRTEDPTTELVHPYYLKSYNQRWFLLALNDRHKVITTFALDRIESIEPSNKPYIKNESIDFSTYFDDVVGVSVPRCEPEKILLHISKEQLPYTLSKPLHGSQTLVEQCEDGSGVVSIHVKPNFELEQLLLSFGERVTILHPTSLKEKILGRLKKNLENYEKVHLD